MTEDEYPTTEAHPAHSLNVVEKLVVDVARAGNAALAAMSDGLYPTDETWRAEFDMQRNHEAGYAYALCMLTSELAEADHEAAERAAGCIRVAWSDSQVVAAGLARLGEDLADVPGVESAEDGVNVPAWRLGDAVLDRAGVVWQHNGYGWECPGRTDWTGEEHFEATRSPLTVLVKDGKAVGYR